MDWDKLRIFHAVAEAGSFTHAANSLNLSQSAISRQVSALEQELSVPLFNRHARGLVMTEQGETLYRTAHDVLLKLDAVKSKLTDSTERPEGKLRLTTTVGLGSSWLTSRIHDFLELYPEVQLEFILENGELDLFTREADCALWFRKPTQGELIQRRLFTVHFHIYASPIYIKRHGQPAGVEELDSHRIITLGDTLPSYLAGLNWLETAGRPSNHPRQPIFTINNLMAVRRVVESGAGIAVLPDYIVEDRHALVQLLPETEMPEYETYFVYPEAMRSSARLRAFRDFLVSKSRQWQF